MNQRHVLLAVGLVVAASLAFFGDKTPAGGIAEPVQRVSASASATSAAPTAPTAPATPARSSAAKRTAGTEPEPVILALQDRSTLIGGAGPEKPAGGLFGSQSWAPPPPPPPKPPPPPPPSAPPLPFTYLGKKVEDNVWEVYLGRGDQTFIVRAQSVIDSIYRVDAIRPPTLTLTYLPLHQVQTLAIGGAD